MTDSKTLKAAGLLLAVFVLGAGAGAGGTLWIESRLPQPPLEALCPPPPLAGPPMLVAAADAPPARKLAAAPAPPLPLPAANVASEALSFEEAASGGRAEGNYASAAEGEVAETKVERTAEAKAKAIRPVRQSAARPGDFLRSLDLSREQGARVREALQGTKAALLQESRASREELEGEVAHLMADLKELIPGDGVRMLEERLAGLTRGDREVLPDPLRVETGLRRWLSRQSLAGPTAERAEASVRRFMDRYWDIYRRAVSAAGAAREKAFESIQETLSPEQRARLEDLRTRSREGGGRPPPPGPPPGPAGRP